MQQLMNLFDTQQLINISVALFILLTLCCVSLIIVAVIGLKEEKNG